MSFSFAPYRRFEPEFLQPEAIEALHALGRKTRADVLRMTTLAASGHPGGSMSSMEMYLLLWALADVDPAAPHRPDRDRIVVSHGHTSPGVYSVLGNLGFFDVEDAVAHFRQAGSPWEGHVERCVPGVEWSTGNLGQGLSAGCGMALAARVRKTPFHVFVVMGDGEQQKGQISEARRFAVKYGLSNLTCLVDRNHLQISGKTESVMPQNVEENFRSDGWKVVSVDGHDLQALYAAIREAVRGGGRCTAIVAETVMGKGVPFMENDEKWHGQALSEEQCRQALEILGQPGDLERYRERRARGTKHLAGAHLPEFRPVMDTGAPVVYAPGRATDNRSAWGRALEDIAKANAGREDSTPLALFDCDLAVSVKTAGFAQAAPDRFFQTGIMEHHAAVAAGALSCQDVQVFWSDFGVFGVDETYNQQRLNDINEANLKVVCTHVGLDVGEDGKTHQCIDYVGALANLFHFKVVIPADPNQTDRVVRWAAAQPGNLFVGMGRSKLNPVVDAEGEPFFGADYVFEYGRADLLRNGPDAVVAAMGSAVPRALKAAELLAGEGLRVTVLNISCPLAVDEGTLSCIQSIGRLVTVEDHNVRTGLGASIARRLVETGRHARVILLGVKDYAASGVPDDVMRLQEMDETAVANAVRTLCERAD